MLNWYNKDWTGDSIIIHDEDGRALGEIKGESNCREFRSAVAAFHAHFGRENCMYHVQDYLRICCRRCVP